MKIILLALVVTTSLFALSQEQKDLAKKIYEVALTAPNSKGETYEETLIRIAITESSLGVNLLGDYKKGQDITEASLGIFQFQMSTVRLLQRKYPNELGWMKNRSDRYLAQKLLKDIDFNIVLAIFNIHRLSESRLTNGSYYRMVSQWNGGIKNTKYYKRVLSYKDLVKKLIKEF